MKIVVICRAFCQDFMILRWQKMAKKYKDLDVILIGPCEYRMGAWQWGKEFSHGLTSFKDENFEFIAKRWIVKSCWRGGPRVPGLIPLLKKIRPDFTYVIGGENSDFLFQVLLARKLFFPAGKVALFTMRGTDMPMHNPNFLLRWTLSRYFIDAYFTHAPCCVRVLREQGKVWQPIYMQTQVGVNTEVFHPDEVARRNIRMEFGISDHTFLFGTACRIDVRKGLMDILDALPLQGVNWKFMICGSGPDEQAVRTRIKERNIEDRVIMTGYVNGYAEMNRYMNAMDCFVLMSQTIPKSNVDTYPLVVSQSMACAKPQIVSDSGGLPYEVESDGWVVHERNVDELHRVMVYAATHPEECQIRGERLKMRLEHSFALTNLNPLFYETAKDIISGRYNMAHLDQMRTKPIYTYADCLEISKGV